MLGPEDIDGFLRTLELPGLFLSDELYQRYTHHAQQNRQKAASRGSFGIQLGRMRGTAKQSGIRRGDQRPAWFIDIRPGDPRLPLNRSSVPWLPAPDPDQDLWTDGQAEMSTDPVRWRHA